MLRALAHSLAVRTYPLRLKIALFFKRPDEYPGTRLTARRLANVYLQRWETMRLKRRLRSRPGKLIIEATNVCNLSCPACFTGDGQVGRPRSHLSLDTYRRILNEIGGTLLQIDFCNWGEPLLAKDLATMIADASRRGIGTLVSTNFSVPFDAERAERLVASGLGILGVSLDGARQETYEQYRVGGDFETVIRNCRLVHEAKQRLGSSTPKMVWSFHVFPHNADDVDAARAMATGLGMEFCPEKAWVVGPEPALPGFDFHGGRVSPIPCLFLWHAAVVNNDGGVSPCCGTFYREDDMGSVGAGGAARFGDVWNGPRFQAARRLYTRRDPAGGARDLICYDCPTTVVWDRWTTHEAAGGGRETFESGYTLNDAFNYFWNRRPEGWERTSRRRRRAS